MDIFSVSADSLFTISSSQNAQKEQFAMQYLQKGLEEFTAKKYDDAITSLKRAVGLAPLTDTAINAYEYIAQSYIRQGKTQAAIDTYKTLLKADPSRDSTHISLGNLYYTNDRPDEANAEYEQALKLNPSTTNRYYLGQGYLATGRLNDALQQFRLIRQQEPTQPQGAFGIGQTYAKMGRYDEAIAAFKDAISIQRDYWDAYAELGYTYADSGDTQAATEIASRLAGNSDALATQLAQYVYEKSQPRMLAAYPNSSYTPFLSALGPNTQVSHLNSYLSEAGNEQAFAINFIFSKAMDRASVENVTNWSINRSTSTGLGKGYNYNLPIPATEISLPGTPYAVYYDSANLTATVLFKIRQNDAADGTIDPSHINFAFTGADQFGLTMDPAADTYSGFTGIA